MSITIDLPPAMMQEAQNYADLTGTNLEKIFLNCLAAELKRRREFEKSIGEWEDKFRSLVRRCHGRLDKPYRFRRADAYEEVLG